MGNRTIKGGAFDLLLVSVVLLSLDVVHVCILHYLSVNMPCYGLMQRFLYFSVTFERLAVLTRANKQFLLFSYIISTSDLGQGSSCLCSRFPSRPDCFVVHKPTTSGFCFRIPSEHPVLVQMKKGPGSFKRKLIRYEDDGARRLQKTILFLRIR